MPKSTELTAPSGNITEALDHYIEANLEGGEEFSLDNLLGEALTVESPEEWDAMFQELDNLQDNHDRQIRVHSVRRGRSTQEGTGTWYLIADVTWLDSGERGAVGVSALMPMAQLVKCHQAGWFPRDFRIEVKQNPTAAGRYPIHLRTLPKQIPAAVEATA